MYKENNYINILLLYRYFEFVFRKLMNSYVTFLEIYSKNKNYK